ncbi:MAG TPA: type VI secretion system tube protein Hcp [Myxococcota bacterium]|nr:type VI secretion system tube protein Hcp [Myxococcota bacterium]
MPADFYLKLGDVQGDSTVSGHEKQIELMSVSLGTSMPVGSRSSGGSATVGKVNISDVSLTKQTDSSSTALFLASCQGTHYDEATISINRPDGQGNLVEYALWTLSDVVVSSYAHSAAGSDMPMESISLNFGAITLTYTPTDPATGAAQGSLTAGWDVGQNKPA